jgi:hypothetical protein
MADYIIDTVAEMVLNASLADSHSLVGCTESEINQIESTHGIRLPGVYLLKMGRKAGRFLEGTDYSFPKVLGFRCDADLLVSQQQIDFHLAQSDFVYLFHQGYTFQYFGCGSNDDPPIFLFGEGDRQPTKIFDSFSAWLLTAVEDDRKSAGS